MVIVRGTEAGDPRLPQHLPAPWEQAGVERLPRRGDERDLPAVHLQVPRLAVRPRRRAAPSSSRSTEFFDLDKSDYGLVPVADDVWEGFIFVNLDANGTTAARSTWAARCRDRGLPVRQDDPGLQVPGRRRQQLEALHRRVRRVLPRARSCTRSRRSPTSRASSRASGSRRSPTSIDGPARHGLVVGGHVAAEGSEHGEADRAGPAQWALRALGPSRHRPRPASVRPQPGSPQGLGGGLVRLLPQLHGARLGAELVPHVPLLADLLQLPRLRGHRCTSSPRRTRPSGYGRSSPR